ncbi:protein SCO1 homolog, mitochondrial-like [Styela clava]
MRLLCLLKTISPHCYAIQHRTYGTLAKSKNICLNFVNPSRTKVFQKQFSTSGRLYFPIRKRRSPTLAPGVGWMSVLFIATVGSISILIMKHFKSKKEEKFESNMIKSMGKPALGGDFTLIDQDGKQCSNRDFLGQWVLIYFGFTHCPDICPEELEKMGNVVDTIKRTPQLPDVQPLFISIDPDRDTPDAVKKYIADFHPNLIGLTGNREQVENASRAFRVYYAEGPKDSEDDYIVDHTVIMYLLNPDGEFCEYFGQNKSAGEMSSSISSIMLKFKHKD